MRSRYLSLILLGLFFIPQGCSDSTEPAPPTPEIAELTVTPAIAAPGALVRITNADLSGHVDAGLSLTIGGEPTLLRKNGNDILTAIPLFIDQATKSSAPPAGALDVELWSDGQLIGVARGAVTIGELVAAPGSAAAVSDDLQAIGTNLQRFVSAMETEPSLEDGYISSWLGALDEMFTADHPYSIPTLLTELERTNPETFALIESVYASSGLVAQTEQLSQYSAALATEAEKLHANADKNTTLQDYQLALRMQFYVVMRDFGADVITQTNQTWSNTVGLVSGIVGIGGVTIPAVNVVSAGLALLDFAINKVALGYLPSHVTAFELTVAEPLINPGDVAQTELWIDATNQPPAIGIQDFINLLLIGLGQANNGGPGPDSFRDFLNNTANWFLGVVRSLMGAYANAHPEIPMDLNIGSIPVMTWRAEVSSDRYAAQSTLTPDIINPVNNILAWRAEIDGSGEGKIFARPASGPTVTTLPMPPGYTYGAGAFGDDILSTSIVSVFVGSQLVLEADMSSNISPGGLNGLGVRAGYRDPLGNITWSDGIQVQCSAVGGTVEDATGVTDAEGRFDTFVSLDSGSDEVTVTVIATGDFGVQQTQQLTASSSGDITLDVSFPTTIEPGVPTTISVTVTSTGDIDGIELDLDSECGDIEVDSATLGASGAFQTTVTMDSDCNSVVIEVEATSTGDDKAFASESVEATRPDAIAIWAREAGLYAAASFYYGDPNNDDQTLWEFNNNVPYSIAHFGEFNASRTASGFGSAEGMAGTAVAHVTGRSDIMLSGGEFSGASFSVSGDGTATLSDPHNGRYGLAATSRSFLEVEFRVWGTSTGSFSIDVDAPGGGDIVTWVELDGESFDGDDEFEVCFEDGQLCVNTNKGQGRVELLYDATGRLTGAQGALPPGEYTFLAYGYGSVRFGDGPNNPAAGTQNYDLNASASISVSR